MYPMKPRAMTPDSEKYLELRRQRVREWEKKWSGVERRRPELRWARALSDDLVELKIRVNCVEAFVMSKGQNKKRRTIMEWLKGKKTYLVAILAIINIVYAFVTGEFGAIGDMSSWGELWNNVAPYFGLGTLRAGVSKITA